MELRERDFGEMPIHSQMMIVVGSVPAGGSAGSWMEMMELRRVNTTGSPTGLTDMLNDLSKNDG